MICGDGTAAYPEEIDALFCSPFSPDGSKRSMGPVEGLQFGCGRVEVRTQAHWQAWSFPSDMVTITPSGSVQSRFIQVPHNAVLNAADFSYPIDGSLQDQYANSFKDEDNNLLARGGYQKGWFKSAASGAGH